MVAVLQRVSGAAVTVDGRAAGAIGRGIVVLLCAVKGDAEKDVVFCRPYARDGNPRRTGVFAAMMSLSLVNEGPVTVLIDSRAASGTA